MRFGLQKKLILAFGFLAAVSLANFGLHSFVEENADEQQVWVSHTHEVIQKSVALLGHLRDAETGQRGFLLTGQPTYLEPYNTGIQNTQLVFSALQHLTRDNPQQQSRLNNLQKKMTEKFSELAKTIQLSQQGRHTEALTTVKNGLGKKIMDIIRKDLNVFAVEEERLLKMRIAKHGDSQTTIRILFALEAFIFIAVIGIISILIQRRLIRPVIKLTKNTVRLAENNELLDIPVPTFGGVDEMGDLIKGFDNMADTINNTLENLINAQLATEESEQRFKNFAEAAADRFWETDEEFRYTYISDLSSSPYRPKPDDIIGKKRWEVSGLNLENDDWSQFKKDIAARKPIRDFQYRRTLSNGNTVWIRVNALPFIDRSGTFKGYRGTNSEVTKEVTAQLKATEQERRLVDTLDNISAGVALYDRNQTLVYCNSQMKTEFSEINDLLIPGTSLLKIAETIERKILVKDENRNHDEWVQQALADHKKSTPIKQQQLYDGRWIEVNRFKTHDGGRLIMQNDISKRKKLEEIKDEFISTVSHELRTPLTSIKGSLGLLKSGAINTGTEEFNSLLEIAYSNSNRLVLLINDILDIEKIEAGKMNLTMEPLNLAELVQKSLEANKGFADEHQVAFVLGETYPAAMVMGDSNRLMQVLSNILSNAAKFSPAGKDVNISVVPLEDRYRVAVADQGLGIPADFQDQIFEKFSQGDASATRQTGGTGLGLSITKAFIEKHGGTIFFDSEAGKGTTFYFELPKYVVGETTPKIDPAVPQDKYRILICEDEPDICKLLDYMLNQNGFETNIAANAKQAKELLGREHFDAMTLDLMLPDQDGISLIRELRQDPKTHDLPILVISSIAEEGMKKLNGDAIGIIDWLEKPIDEQALTKRLHNALSRADEAKPHILHIEDDADVIHIVSTIVKELGEINFAKSTTEAKQMLRAQDYDLVILDLMLPDGRGEDLLPLLNRSDGSLIPVIIFSAREFDGDLAKNIQSVLVKSQTTNEVLLAAISSSIKTPS